MRFFVFFTMFFVAVQISAQSIHRYNKETKIEGDVILEKIDNNTFKIPAAPFEYYKKMPNNEFWVFYTNDAIEVENPIKTFVKSDNLIKFYNKEKNIIGFYVPTERRFYMTTSQGENILKSQPVAVFENEEILVVNTAFDEVSDYFKVDPDLAIEYIGFYFFW